MTGTIVPLAPGDFAGLSGKVSAGLMLRLVLTALYVSLKLIPQHRFYLSEFRIAKLALLIQFLEVRQQVVSGLSASNGLIAQFSHHHESHGHHQRQDQERDRELPGCRREKLPHDSTRAPQAPDAWPLPCIMHIAGRRSSFVWWTQVGTQGSPPCSG